MMSSLLGGSCPAGWRYYMDNCSCFYMSKTVADQTTARSVCQARGADLASISNQAEMNFVNRNSWVMILVRYTVINRWDRRTLWGNSDHCLNHAVVVQGHWIWRRSIDHTLFNYYTYYRYATVSVAALYHFRVTWPWIILWLWNLA